MSSVELRTLNEEVDSVLKDLEKIKNTDLLIRNLQDKIRRLVEEKIQLELTLQTRNNQIKCLNRLKQMRNTLNTLFPLSEDQEEIAVTSMVD